MKILRKVALAALAALSITSTAALGSTEAAADYPNKMVRIVVPFSPGGGTSNAARFLADKLSAKWGQSVIVDNRPGGNTVIGSSAVAKADADGYTLLFANTSFTINPSVMPNLPYDSVRNFSPICTILVNRFVLLTNPSVKAKNLDEFIKLLRANPDAYNLPTVGATGIGRLAGEGLMQLIGVQLQNVPYKGTSDLATNLAGGQLQFALEIPGFYLPYLKAGKLNALAVSGNSRLASMPDVPTFAEEGLKKFDVQSWYGLLAPANTPEPILNKIAADVQTIIKSDEFDAYLNSIQAEPLITSPAEFTEMIKREIAKHHETATLIGITAKP